MRVKGLKKDEYDAVIIGAGIGGLVCGCYLAKAGMKVLIAEKNDKPGGYCTTFSKNNFYFDACVHSFGSYRKGGNLWKIVHELAIEKKINILKANPSDVIITPDFEIAINDNIKKFSHVLLDRFPMESRGIRSFSKLIEDGVRSMSSFRQLESISFASLLDNFFKDKKLKSILSIFLGNIGVSPSVASALATIVLYREYIFDGGYYPKGGMQSFSDALADQFRDFGGTLKLSSLVDKIIIKKDKVAGVNLDKGHSIFSNFVISNCDVTKTLFSLIEKTGIKKRLSAKLNEMKVSSSAFIIYLGVRNNRLNNLHKSLGLWLMPKDYDIEKAYGLPFNGRFFPNNDFVFCAIPSFVDDSLCPKGTSIVRAIVNAPFKNESFWVKNKKHFYDILLRRTLKLFGGLDRDIITSAVATPMDLNTFTFNGKGAMCGWAATTEQCDRLLLSARSDITGLYFTGHWVTEKYGQGGIGMVAFSGKKVANMVLKDKTNCKL